MPPGSPHGHVFGRSTDHESERKPFRVAYHVAVDKPIHESVAGERLFSASGVRLTRSGVGAVLPATGRHVQGVLRKHGPPVWIAVGLAECFAKYLAVKRSIVVAIGIPVRVSVRRDVRRRD